MPDARVRAPTRGRSRGPSLVAGPERAPQAASHAGERRRDARSARLHVQPQADAPERGTPAAPAGAQKQAELAEQQTQPAREQKDREVLEAPGPEPAPED